MKTNGTLMKRCVKISNISLKKISGQFQIFTNSLSTGYVFLKLFRYFASQLFHGLFIFHKGYNLLDGLSTSMKIMGFD